MNDGAVIPCLMPLPMSVEKLDGARPLLGRFAEAEFTGVRTPRLERAIARLTAAQPAVDDPTLPLAIECRSAGNDLPALDDDESHTLTVSKDGVRIMAPAEWGVLRALVTLTQLCAGVAGAGIAELPALRIVDAPRFRWRGLMLDVARHFIPLPDLLRTLDAMAIFKLNVLHLHLSDDQGFRFPSARYPQLPSEQHYTRAELDTLIVHAADRGIRVVPELDMPGHTTSWLLAYPQWGNRPAAPSRRFGVHQACLDPTRPEVLEAVATLLGEVAATFPDRYLHVGGDEVHPAWWSDDPGIRAFMDRHGLKDAPDLQARFNAHVAGAVGRLGRKPIGWDEVLHRDLPAALTVQAWRGATARDRALAAGHDCIVSAPYYLDLLYPAGVHYDFDPAAPEAELLAREDALLEDPRFAHVAGGMAWTRQWREHGQDLAPAAHGKLLGAEACLWSELVDARVLDVRLWSRMPALAERFWSPASCRDVDDMYRRLAAVHERLPGWAGVDVPGDRRRLAAQAGVTAAWQPLVDMLEPVKWYGRLLGEEALAARLRGAEMPQARPYDADSPLDRMVDALAPESDAARELARLTRAEAGGDTGARDELRALAGAWQALPDLGGPAELEPAAERLRQLGRLTLAVLDDAVPAADARRRLAEAAQPIGEYLLAPALVLQEWLEQRIGPAAADA